MIDRPRLLPAVILGAMGLLALKLLGWAGAPYPGRVPVSPPLIDRPTAAAGDAKDTAAKDPNAKEPNAKEPWALAKFIARAHAPDALPDPETTGSVEKKDDKKAEAEAKAEAARAASPNNRAGLMNGAAKGLSPAERALLERLGERREEIESRMRELDMREKLLDTAEKRLDGRVGDLKRLEDKIEGPKDAKEAGEQQGLKSLVIMYEAMKPKDAARVFDRLNLDVLVPVVQQMNPRKMSDVLAAMSPETAERLTVAIAMRARGGAERGAPPVAPASLPSGELPAVEPQPRR